MTVPNRSFNNVTLLITHYNRSHSLERLLRTFRDTGSSFQEIVISDDGSKQEHIDYINSLKDQYDFRLVTTPKNRGLGNNINKGQDAVNTEYVLYIQEDFVPLQPFAENFSKGLAIMEEDKTVDTVRFYSYLNYPKLVPVKDGFSEMVFDAWSFDLDKVPMYSDHPHLRRKNFFDKFGRYAENKSGDKTEYDMMISFLRNRGKAYLFADYKALLEPINSSSEPSTMLDTRNFWRNNNSFVLRNVRAVYRWMLFNYSYYLKK
jgi:glycosyltransferase involved in cell wall biosynthesis